MLATGTLVSLVALVSMTCALRTDQEYWTELAQTELTEALRVTWNTGVAKNVVLFVGDGMGPNTITATRIHLGGESHRLEYEKFPHVGLLKTYSANKIVPDSASAATALFCGVKANQETAGVDASVSHKDCAASLQPKAQLKSLAALALEAGKSAGFVTTMRVTHATPAPLYAHSAARRWECDARMPPDIACKDIARQLIEDWPGRDLHVILGGGRAALVANATSTAGDPVDAWACARQDGRDLLAEYKKDKTTRGLKHSVVFNNQQLSDLDTDNTDYLLGVFANSHLKYENERDKSPKGMPSISEMVEAAIKVLKNNKNGFFLMVEGGNIDLAHHRGRAKVAVSEAAALEAAVRLAVAQTDRADTLLVVTSDHSHTLAIAGYPYRGTSIFGIAARSPLDGVNYTSLLYGTGGPDSRYYYTLANGSIARHDPVHTDSYKYQQAAAVALDENSHGGNDVMVYAIGPQAHLFHSVHEQHYVYHALAHAARLRASRSPGGAPATRASLLALVASSVAHVNSRWS